MHKQSLIVLILVAMLITLSCTISYEGINFGFDPDVDKIEQETADAAKRQDPTPKPVNAGSEVQAPQGSEAGSANAGTNTYSVTATNFDCICQVDGDVTASFKFNGDVLEFTNPGGEVDEFEKIGENTYKRTFMGYYILDSGSGTQVTSTVVEEEKHVVIKITTSGYVMEHYSGDSSSPCCYHTHTIKK
jgi:hypothetical protein